VGSPIPTLNNENSLLTILESQNRHFSELLKQVQHTKRVKRIVCCGIAQVRDQMRNPGVQRWTTSCPKTNWKAALL